MGNSPRIQCFKTLERLAHKIKRDLREHDFVLLFAHNRTGKTRLSMEFKNIGKNKGKNDTLYFNAFTEDLFIWDNDLKNDSKRCLKINSDSRFVTAFKGRDRNERIRKFIQFYADFIPNLNIEEWKITFSRGNNDNIKISRGEENTFIWCMFLVVVEFVLDGDESYKDIKYIYIDDPVSSLDDGNAIAVACDIARIFKKEEDKKVKNKKEVKTIISSHHGLFFNALLNEIKGLKKAKRKTYFYYRSKDPNIYKLRHTGDTPLAYHLVMLGELKNATKTKKLYTYHFNIMRSILETTAIFFGFEKFSDCIQPSEDKDFHARALNLLSHGNYPVYSPKDMVDDNKELFEKIVNNFTTHYKFKIDSFFETP